MKKLLIGLIKPTVYVYRRRRDFGVSPLPSNDKFLSRLGTNGLSATLNFPKQWTGSATDILTSESPSAENDSGTKLFADHAASGIVDVLGSGPVRPDQHFKAAGAFGHKYHQPLPSQEFQQRLESMKIELENTRDFLDDRSDETGRLIERISNANYELIDWHIDVKSGYRWDPQGWWLDQHFGNVPGVDIKVPWEISRGHDLVSLAISSATSINSNAVETISLRLLDWIIANPARKGVNWRSTMEVAIRATNWIWALAISQPTQPVSPSIIWIVARSLEQHASFIEQHPDAGGPGANNHYIADMAGLAHIAAALSHHKHAESWGATAATGLHQQTKSAIGEDGFSYEGSTGYHRYVTELLTHGTLATLRFPSAWAASSVIDQTAQWKILRTMFDAAENLRKPIGLSPQFGDHDAGRFLKFHRPIIRSGAEDTNNFSHLQLLAGGISNAPSHNDDSSNPEFLLPTLGIDTPELSVARRSFDSPRSPQHNSIQSGAWSADTDRLWLAVRCFNSEPLAPTGHLHDDSLSIELSIDNQDVLVDPGTGVYTADASTRNQLRSRGQHSTVGPQSNGTAEFAEVFNLPQQGLNEVHTSEESRFSGTYQTEKWAVTRSVEVTETGFNIVDAFRGTQPWRQVFVFHPNVSVSLVESPVKDGVKLIVGDTEFLMRLQSPADSVKIDQAMYSPHYGVIVPTQRLVVNHSEPGSSQINFELG